MDNPINYWYQKYIALKAQMDEMMKWAVEGFIWKDSLVTQAPFYFVRSVNMDVPPNGVNENDKVKVIIVKEDEK